MEFFDKFCSDNAKHPLDKFYESKAKDVVMSAWKEPGDEGKSYKEFKVIKQRTCEAEFKVDSAFVKAAPTLKTYRLVEYNPNCIKVLCLNRTRDIPYCDTFDVEDLLVIQSISPTSQCCVVQIGL